MIRGGGGGKENKKERKNGNDESVAAICTFSQRQFHHLEKPKPSKSLDLTMIKELIGKLAAPKVSRPLLKPGYLSRCHQIYEAKLKNEILNH